MTKLNWCVSGLLIAFLAASGVANAADSATCSPTSKAVSEYDLMVAELNLTPDQQTQIKAKFDEMAKALAQWDAEHQAALDQLQAKIDRARTAGNMDEVLAASQEKAALLKERAELADSLRAAILELLTPQQRELWEGLKLYQALLPTYAKVKLTGDQPDRIRQLCNQAAKEILALGDKSDAKSIAEIKTRLTQTINETVLTADQAELMKPKEPPAPVVTSPQAPMIQLPTAQPSKGGKGGGEGGGEGGSRGRGEGGGEGGGKKQPSNKPKGEGG